MRFEIEPKAASLNMRLPAPLLDAVKEGESQRHSLHALCADAVGRGFQPSDENSENTTQGRSTDRDGMPEADLRGNLSKFTNEDCYMHW